MLRGSKADADFEDDLLDGRHKLLGADRDAALDNLLCVKHVCLGQRPHHQLHQTLGLLKTNRQIYTEGFEILYGMNVFAVFFEPGKRHLVWHCGDEKCTPTGTSLVSERALMHIKHMSVHIQNPRGVHDEELWSDTAHLATMIHNFCRLLAQHGMVLRTLSVRYHGCFGGQLESVRWAPDPGPEYSSILPASYTVRIVDYQGHEFTFPVSDRATTRCMFATSDVLDGLKMLEGRTELAKITGDVPALTASRLVNSLQGDNRTPLPGARERHNQERIGNRRVRRAGPYEDFASYVSALLAKNQKNPHVRRLAEAVLSDKFPCASSVALRFSIRKIRRRSHAQGMVVDMDF